MKIFRNRTVIGVLCILLALIICFGVTPLFSRSASEKTEIVRVTKDIKEGDEITAEMVQTVEVGAYNLPQNLMTDKKEIVGKYATADLAVGDYILSSKLSTVPAAENAYLYNLDGTKQAISVTIKNILEFLVIAHIGNRAFYISVHKKLADLHIVLPYPRQFLFAC